MSRMELEGKVALVTGSGVRLGRALALALAREGAGLIIHYHASADAAEDTVQEIRALGRQAIRLQADLSRFGEMRPLVEQARTRMGRLDVLVNSAAIFQAASVADTSERNWDRHFALNLKAPFFLSQAFAAQVAADQRAHIVNIADWRGVQPEPEYLAYSLTKAGLLAMTKALALALAPTIQVNAIAPGAILPPPGEDQGYLEELAKHRIPLRRPGSPAEVAKALIYLISSDFVTGETLFVTGAQHLA
jgi:pteridine reductase